MAPARVIETELALPGGLILDDGRRLTRARLRALTGAEEEWLAEARGVASAVKVTRVLSSCVMALDGESADTERIRRMLVGDRDYLMLELRRLTLGDEVVAVIACPACNAPLDAEFQVSDVPVERRPQTAAWYTGERGVRFRLPTGGDQEAVLGLEAPAAEEALLKRCLWGEEGVELSRAEREAAIAEMERQAPRVDLELDLTCSECGHRFLTPFDMTAFFFEEMRARSGQLLREVHTLAFYYHWSEADILGLGRRRRHAYLNLLSDSLRQE
jgi:hypothetical protein